jgi:hypothetical protein
VRARASAALSAGAFVETVLRLLKWIIRDSVEGIVWAVPAGNEGAPVEVRGARQDNRLFLSRANRLDKIRNVRYLNGISFPARRQRGRGRGCLKRWPTTRRASRAGGEIFLFQRLQPIEKSRFQKINASKR